MRSTSSSQLGSARLVACAALLQVACEQDPEPAPTPRWLSEPTALGERLAFVDGDEDRVCTLNVGSALEPAPVLDCQGLPENPVASIKRSGTEDMLLIRSAGLRGVGDGPELVVLGEAAAQRRYPLSRPYTALSTRDDGSYALAYFTAGSDGVFAPADAAVIDLEGAGQRAVTEVSLEVDGAAPKSVWLTAPLETEGGVFQLALASYARHVALLDLTDPGAGPIIITLTGEVEADWEVRDVTFLPEQGRIAFLARGSQDVFVLSLEHTPDAARHFRVAVDQYFAGESPIALTSSIQQGVARLLVLADQGRELRWVAPADGSAGSLPLETTADGLATCQEECRYALAYARGRAVVTLIDLAGLSLAQPSATRPLRSIGEVSAVLADAAHARVYLQHEAGALTLCDLASGSLLPIGVPAHVLADVQLAADGALWFAVPGDYLVARFDPELHDAREVLLSQPIRSLVLVPGAQRAVVVHERDQVSLSLLDLSAPTRVDPVQVRVEP
jgi:hypothetical protein